MKLRLASLFASSVPLFGTLVMLALLLWKKIVESGILELLK